MMNGIKTDGQNITCASCGQKVSKDGTLKLNFCPKCGNPLNIDASVKYEKTINHEKLVMLYELIDTINENNEDAKKVINDFIKELENED